MNTRRLAGSYSISSLKNGSGGLHAVQRFLVRWPQFPVRCCWEFCRKALKLLGSMAAKAATLLLAGMGFRTVYRRRALPRYKKNEFPNWYGSCVNWGHYSSSGTAPF
jgi:hypothetical protein